MAAARPPGPAPARIHPRRHNQDPDAVSSRHRPGAAATSGPRHQCGPAPVAARAPERDPGGAARPHGFAGGGCHASGLGGVAGGPDHALHLIPHDLPPLRLLLVWDNLAGHKTPDLVLWLCAQGVMPLYTPVGGSWLNMAESIER